MDRLRAGVALFNASHYLAAHEPWEDLWLKEPAGERNDCLQGLIQATAAIHKARIGNHSGAVGLAEGAQEYLEGCEGVAVAAEPLGAYLTRLEADPAVVEAERPPALTLDGTELSTDDLRIPAALIAVDALTETRGDDAVAASTGYARREFESSGTGTGGLIALLFEYLRDPNPIVRERIGRRVEKQAAAEADVDGLFEG